MSKKISVVLPVYNAEKHLEETLESIINQTYTNFELVIVNHASTDRSKDIITLYSQKDERIKVVDLKINTGGPAHPRNEGIKFSKGEYIALIDSDDIWKKEKLERCMIYDGADIIYHKEIYFRDVLGNLEQECNTKDFEDECNIYYKLLVEGNNFSPSAIMIKRNILIKNLFNEDMLFHTVEDYDLWIRLSKNGYSYKFLNEVLGFYRLHDSAASKNFKLHGKNARHLIKYHFSNFNLEKNFKMKSIMYKKLFRSIFVNVYYTLKYKQKLDIFFYLKEMLNIFKRIDAYDK